MSGGRLTMPKDIGHINMVWVSSSHKCFAPKMLPSEMKLDLHLVLSVWSISILVFHIVLASYNMAIAGFLWDCCT